jgi:DNA-binding FadR family transcriptional regulator
MTSPAAGGYAPKRAEAVVDRLGREMMSGELAPGAVLLLDEIERRFGVSRTVARDAVKELEGLGMLVGRRRVGLQIRERSEWSVFHPRVIAWRMASSERRSQLLSLTELRLGLEPRAAELAAERRTPAQAQDLLRLAERLDLTGRAGEMDAYLRADITFHRIVFEATANEFFIALSPSVEAALSSRTGEGLMPSAPSVHSFALHKDVATSIGERDAVGAERSMRALLADVVTEVGGT